LTAARNKGVSLIDAASGRNGLVLSTGFAERLAEETVAIQQVPLSPDQISDLFAYYENQLTAALSIVETSKCQSDPGDLAVLVEAMLAAGALEISETIDDRVALGIVTDLILARLVWFRDGPASHYAIAVVTD
jgi:hypothetical protein